MKYKPSINFLPKLSEIKNTKEQEKNVENLNKLFKEHKIKAEVKGFETGPIISKYHVYLLKGGKHKDVVQIHKEIALTTGSKVGYTYLSGPIPGKHYFNIESVNNNITTLPLRYFLESPKMLSDESKTIIPIGLNIYGQIDASDIRDLPHLLITGMKKSGKTIFLHSIITSLILRNSPKELKFVLITPKTNQFDIYKKIPYLATPIIKNPAKIREALEWAMEKLYERYELLESQRVSGIERYNEINKDKMETIVLIIDDLSKCFKKTPKAIETYLVRLAQRGRAIGIHMFISSTDIRSNYIPGLLQANILGRVVFKVADSRTSVNVVYRSGAEKLFGKGDMLYVPPYSCNHSRLQAPYISKDDLVKLIKKVAV